MTQEITVTRALVKLKLLGKQIEKEIGSAKFVGLYQERKRLIRGLEIPIDSFEKDAKAAYESIKALIENRKATKGAILRSNADTIVEIAGVDYTVAEAIERKNTIELEKLLLNKLKREYAEAMHAVQENNVQLEESVSRMLEQNLGTDKKATESDYKNIAEPFIKQNQLNISDPIKVRQVYEKLEKELDEFLAEVDFALSESNAKTVITI